MASLRDALRFFRVVPPVPRLMISSFAVVTVAGGAAMLSRRDGAPDAVVPVLLLQLFAVSAGFASSARRGYYDVLLTSGIGRLAAALVHWAMCAAPGALCCLTLATLDTLVSTDVHPVASSGTAAALFVVSTIPWATTLSLPRFSGGIGWMLLSATAVTVLPYSPSVVVAWATTPAASAWQAVLGFLLFPTEVAGTDVAIGAPGIATGLGIACASMGFALTWIHRTDLPLEAAQ